MENSINWIIIGSVIDIIFNGLIWFIIGLCILPIIDVSDLQSGLYLVEVERNGLQMTSKLIVK